MAYKVRVPMYKSEVAAERLKIMMQPLIIPGSVLMPASLIATTNGDAAADLPALVEKMSSFEL